MNFFGHPFNLVNTDAKNAAPFGRSPDGQWIVSAENLPGLPIPKHAVVTKDFIEFDCWVFPLPYVSKSLLVWLKASFLRWVKEDESEKNKEWINGIVEAFQDALAGEL
jgi:hypothetical protein